LDLSAQIAPSAAVAEESWRMIKSERYRGVHLGLYTTCRDSTRRRCWTSVLLRASTVIGKLTGSVPTKARSRHVPVPRRWIVPVTLARLEDLVSPSTLESWANW